MNSVSPFLGLVFSAYILTLILLLTSIFLPFRLLCCFGKTFYFQKCQWKAVGAKGGTPLPHLSWGERPLITLGGHPTFRDALTQTQSRADPPCQTLPPLGYPPSHNPDRSPKLGYGNLFLHGCPQIIQLQSHPPSLHKQSWQGHREDLRCLNE